MSSPPPSTAREGALAKLAAEAARFTPATNVDDPPAAAISTLQAAAPLEGARAGTQLQPPVGGPAGYVPVAVAPERGNTRPVVPVDGRIHMRMAQPTVDALDAVVARWKAEDPTRLRDLERATLVRIAVAMLLTDIAQNSTGGAVGEAVRRALDPAVRHTDTVMPDLTRWLRVSPAGGEDLDGDSTREDRPVVAAYGSRSPD